MNSKQLREKMGALVSQMRAHVDANPVFNSESQNKYDAIEAEVSAIEKQIVAAEKLEAREKAIGAVEMKVPNVNAGNGDVDVKEHEAKVKATFRKYMAFGEQGLEPEERTILRQRYVAADGRSAVNSPRMALTTTGSGGGYLIPQGFSDQLEQAMKWYGGIAQAASIMKTETGNPLPYPTANDTAQKATLLGINAQAAEVDPSFGNVIFNAYKFTSGVVQVPLELLQDSYFDMDAYVAKAFGERFGRAWNSFGTTGTGASQPMGIVTAVTGGAQNIQLATGNTVTIVGDNLIDLEHAVDIAYRPQSKYMLNDGTLKIIRKLKDGYGRYLWQPGVEGGGIVGGQPAMLNGYQYIVNNDMAVPASNAYSILFGDFSRFKIRQVNGYIMLRLDERYADYGQVGFIAFQRWDSNLIDAGTHPVAALQQSTT